MNISTSIQTRPNPNTDQDYDTLITFKVCDGLYTITTFGYPIMDKKCLRDLIAGNNTNDQDDEGFNISLSEGVVQISINRDCEHETTVFKFPHKVCLNAFEQIMNIYIAINAFDMDDYKDMDSYSSSDNDSE